MYKRQELEETSVMVGMKDMLTSEKMYLEEVIKKAKLQLKKAGIQGEMCLRDSSYSRKKSTISNIG